MHRILVAKLVFAFSIGFFPNVGMATEEPLCIDQALSRIGVNFNQSSDPAIVQDLLENEFFLTDFSDGMELFADLSAKPVALKPFLDGIRTAVLRKHPAIAEFLCAAYQQEVFPESIDINVINRTIHRVLILESLTQAMAKDIDFMVRLKDYYLALREPFLEGSKIPGSVGRLTRLLSSTGGFFQGVKLLTMDRVFQQYIDFRLKGIGALDESDLDSKKTGLFINLTEARTAALKAKRRDSAHVAKVLRQSKMISLQTVAPNGIVVQQFAPGWTELYETWNFAFITAQMPNLQMYYPKLLIPSVIDATPDEYLFYRGISLWLTININLQYNLNYPDKTPTDLENKNELAELWDSINRKYLDETLSLEKGASN